VFHSSSSMDGPPGRVKCRRKRRCREAPGGTIEGEKERCVWRMLGGLRTGPPPEAGSVIDLGCGRGAVTAVLQARTGCRVIGVDRSPLMLELARAAYHEMCWIAGQIDENGG
jgi:trans-aconitate methyltransferase